MNIKHSFVSVVGVVSSQATNFLSILLIGKLCGPAVLGHVSQLTAVGAISWIDRWLQSGIRLHGVRTGERGTRFCKLDTCRFRHQLHGRDGGTRRRGIQLRLCCLARVWCLPAASAWRSAHERAEIYDHCNPESLSQRRVHGIPRDPSGAIAPRVRRLQCIRGQRSDLSRIDQSFPPWCILSRGGNGSLAGY